jgi:hypothetical protein
MSGEKPPGRPGGTACSWTGKGGEMPRHDYHIRDRAGNRQYNPDTGAYVYQDFCRSCKLPVRIQTTLCFGKELCHHMRMRVIAGKADYNRNGWIDLEERERQRLEEQRRYQEEQDRLRRERTERFDRAVRELEARNRDSDFVFPPINYDGFFEVSRQLGRDTAVAREEAALQAILENSPSLGSSWSSSNGYRELYERMRQETEAAARQLRRRTRELTAAVGGEELPYRSSRPLSYWEDIFPPINTVTHRSVGECVSHGPAVTQERGA